MPSDKKIVKVLIDTELHSALRIWCFERGKTMQSVLGNAVFDIVHRGYEPGNLMAPEPMIGAPHRHLPAGAAMAADFDEPEE
jgi:hypothetical protein